MKWIFLFLAGGVGTMARYLLSGVVYQSFGSRFPYGTLMINVLGCFLIGFLVALSQEKVVMSENVKLFLIIGFLGAFTTFSTFIFETASLIRTGQSLAAFFNVLISVVIGFLFFELGFFLGEIV